MNLLQQINLFSGCVLAVVMIIVIRKRKFDRYVLPFLFLILINIAGLVAIVLETSYNPALWSTGYYLLFFHVAFLPLAFLWLGGNWGVDTTEFGRSRKRLTLVFAFLSVLFFFYLLVELGIDIGLLQNRWLLDLKKMSVIYSAMLIIGVTLGLYFIENCYRSSLGLARERIRRSFFPLLAYGIGLLAVATVALLFRQVGDWMMTITFFLLAMVTIPASRHYLLFKPGADGIILTRKGIYSSLVVVLVGIYFVIIGAIGEILIKYNLNEGLFYSVVVLSVLVCTFMILLVSQTIRSRIKALSLNQASGRARHFFADEWKEFSEEVSVTLNMEAIYERTNRLLYRLLKINQTIFVIKEPAPSENYTLYIGDGIDRGISGRRLERINEWLYRLGRPVETSTLVEKAEQEGAEYTAFEQDLPFSAFLLVPLIARQQYLGFWAIGPHGTGGDLTSDEISFIEAAANPVALTILGARMTDELVVAREIESFQRISAFVLHDLKNSVGMLSMLLQNAEANMEKPDFQREAILTIGRAVERQKKIISRLTEQKSDDTLHMERVNLRSLVQNTLDRVKLGTVKSISLEMDIAEDCFAMVDTDKVGSVFDNLIMNALEAMPEGGTITICCAPMSDDGLLKVSVSDTGCGMDTEFISTRLFKPFSSTKPHGLGIGMFQSREIIRAHNGRIEVTSVSGEGSTFSLYIPGA